MIINEGKIIDASIDIATYQRKTREENQEIKMGEDNSLQNTNPHKKNNKDIDTSQTKKLDIDLRLYEPRKDMP